MKSLPYRYKLIQLRSAERPPNRGMPTDHLTDIDGTPHTGGIDVRYGDVIRTITWGKIAFADRVQPQEA
jgi:hypothetical protein